MKVQLIQPTTGEYNSNSRSGCYPPLGLVSIATYLQSQLSEIEIEILDGEFLSQEELIDSLDADFVGINANTVTYPQALEVAEAAKQRRSITVLGGVYASAMAHPILRFRKKLFDHIVVGYGELPMLEILRGNKEKVISGDFPVIIQNQKPYFNETPYPDRSIIDLEKYLKRFKESHPTWSDKSTNIFTNVGCFWREKTNGGCIFCSRSGDYTTTRSPLDVWAEVRELVESYGINYLVDFSDTILQHTEWLEELVSYKPPDLDPEWHIFGRVDEITQKSIDIIKQLPCKHIFVGLESGHPSTYKAARKGGGSPEQSLITGSLMRRNGIEMTASYVLGLPGESNETINATYDHARRMQDITGFEEIFCCPLIPFPGSIAYARLAQQEGLESDVVDIEVAKRLWAKHFCNVSFDVMEEAADKILDLGTYKITISKKVMSGSVQFKRAHNHTETLEDEYSCV